MLAPPPDGRPRRLVYLGTPAVAVPPLEALVAAGHEVALVVSQPDRRRGRGSAVTPSPVKAAALGLGLTVSDRVEDVLAADADLGVVVAFGRILAAELLAELPMVNLHFSLLPRWRGAAPVERALLAGDAETGVCLMAVAEGLDEGDVYARATVPIGATTTADELRAALVRAGTELLVTNLDGGLPAAVPQEGEVTIARKIAADDLLLRWEEPAPVLDRIVRLGGAWTTLDGERLKVWACRLVGGAGAPAGTLDGTVVACGHGALELVEVQPAGRARQAATDWARGARLQPGTRLGT